ncbi:nonsense-mediated mRNA decay protein 2-like [Senna tora]|uniref:Nonsense-mediated mRNA decay protein 2-like n=1 Tax=Senna tora TaxID=362788 RepID=A0A835C8D7_9FABA|nr:nonsense-mediated mRNA decay protein 2-like [Senna tora]
MIFTLLFHEFLVRLNLYRFFGHFIFGEDYSARKTRSKNIFKAALKCLVEAGIHTFNLHTLAHALQNLGQYRLPL